VYIISVRKKEVKTMNKERKETPEQAIYYHVTAKWDGQDLESLYDRYGEKAYDMYADRWPDAEELAYAHAHIIHLHATEAKTKEYAEVYGGEILIINDRDNDLDVEIDGLEKGARHPVCRQTIDKHYISRL
jgi:hypothetical protein